MEAIPLYFTTAKRYYTLRYDILLDYDMFCYTILLLRTLLGCTPLQICSFYSASTLPHPTLLCSALHYSTMLTDLSSTLLYSTLLYYIGVRVWLLSSYRYHGPVKH